MHFQKAHASIVRSIRQVSLFRDWQRARASRKLPDIADFTPNERAGDSADILITEVVRRGGALNGNGLSYLCRSAGERVEQLYDMSMSARPLDDCLDRAMANAARPIWDACIQHRLPMYCILPLSDLNGCPVTVEQIFLPYSRGGDTADFMLGALHAWSTEGRFASQGLLRNVAKVPVHWAVIIDPAQTRAPPPTRDAGNQDTGNQDTGNQDTGNQDLANQAGGNDDIEFDSGLPAPSPAR